MIYGLYELSFHLCLAEFTTIFYVFWADIYIANMLEAWASWSIIKIGPVKSENFQPTWIMIKLTISIKFYCIILVRFICVIMFYCIALVILLCNVCFTLDKHYNYYCHIPHLAGCLMSHWFKMCTYCICTWSNWRELLVFQVPDSQCVQICSEWIQIR